jgi:NAD(P)-dependent dehydrogenase (short-subunit alcohol dehydrogenase family)
LPALLLPALLRTPGARIVTVTSTAHHMGRAVNPANPHLHGRYRPWRAYGQAKLANFHFGLGLQRELEKAGAGAASLIAHPGMSNTDLQAVSVQATGGGASQRFFLFLARRTGMSAAEGALSQLRAATDPAANGGELPVPLEVIYELGLSPAVRLAAGRTELTGEQLNEIASACWRAISRPA